MACPYRSIQRTDLPPCGHPNAATVTISNLRAAFVAIPQLVGRATEPSPNDQPRSPVRDAPGHVHADVPGHIHQYADSRHA